MKLTASEIKKNYTVISLGYCKLQELLAYKRRLGYTSGVYGWSSDIYYFDNFVISTGYRPVKGLKVDNKVINKYVNKFLKFTEGNPSYEEREEKALQLLNQFINEVAEGV